MKVKGYSIRFDRATAERFIDALSTKAKRRASKCLNLIQHAHDGFQREHGWTAAEPALLGTVPDEDVAARIGRPVNAVRIKRTRLGIATAHDRRRRRQQRSC
jgi:hypothetical protein